VRPSLSLIAVAAVLAGCGDDPFDPSSIDGLWGGVGAELVVGPTFAVLRLTCAQGPLAGRPEVEDGTFESVVTLETSPGFQQRGAFVRGELTGRYLTLSVTEGYSDVSQQFLLFPGQPGELDGPCPR
jgi:hypothetical protein